MLSYGSTFADIVTDAVATTANVEALRMSIVKVQDLLPIVDRVTVHARVELSANHEPDVPVESVPLVIVT